MKLLALIMIAVCLAAGAARAQNPVVPTQPCTDSSSRAASTRFVTTCAPGAGGGMPAISIVGKSAVPAPAINASCGASDSTAALQAASTYLSSTTSGGTILITCPITVAGQATFGSNIRLTGVGPMYYGGMIYDSRTGGNTPAVWPPPSGPAINCTNTAGGLGGAPCLLAAGQGVEIDHIQLGNPQPAPSGGTYTPTAFPFIIGTSAAADWNGLQLHHLTFTSADQCIDLEGTPNYNTAGIAGAQWTISNIWFNPCLNTGIKFHLIDNTGTVSNVLYDFWWNRNVASVTNYYKTHSVGMDVCYLANARFDSIEFDFNAVGMQFKNCTVTIPLKTFAATKLQMTNIDFNTVCQGMSVPNGNGTITEGVMTNVVIGQQFDAACPSQFAFFDLSSDFAQWDFDHVQANSVQTLAAIGGLSAGSSGSHGILHFDHTDIVSYSANSAGAPAFKVVAGTSFSLGTSDKAGLRPAAGAGNLLGPGIDTTQGYEQLACVGGSANAAEGAVCLQGSQNGTNTGSVTFYTPNGTQRGFAGAGTTAGVNYKAKGSLKTFVGNENETVSFGDDGASHNLIGVAPLPTAPPSGTGTAYVCVDNLGQLYTKAACP